MLHEYPVLDAYDICGNPIHREPEVTKSTVYDDEITFGHNDSRVVFQCWRSALYQVKQTLTTRSDVSAMLNVFRRPESLRSCVVTFVEKRVESSEHQCLVFLLEFSSHGRFLQSLIIGVGADSFSSCCNLRRLRRAIETRSPVDSNPNSSPPESAVRRSADDRSGARTQRERPSICERRTTSKCSVCRSRRRCRAAMRNASRWQCLEELQSAEQIPICRQLRPLHGAAPGNSPAGNVLCLFHESSPAILRCSPRRPRLKISERLPEILRSSCQFPREGSLRLGLAPQPVSGCRHYLRSGRR